MTVYTKKAMCAPCHGRRLLSSRYLGTEAPEECWFCDGKGWVPRPLEPGEGCDDDEEE